MSTLHIPLWVNILSFIVGLGITIRMGDLARNIGKTQGSQAA